MVRRFHFILAIILLTLNGFAGMSKTDSLLARLETVSEEEKIDLYFELADQFYFNSYADFIHYSRKAKELAIKYELPDKVLSTDNAIAIGYNQLGVFDSA